MYASEFVIDRFLAEPPTEHEHEPQDTTDDNIYPDEEPILEESDGQELADNVQLYQDVIVMTPAYDWLIGTMQREAKLSRAIPDIMGKIRSDIIGALPSSYRVSRRTSSREYKAMFDLDWDPLSFIKGEQFAEPTDEALQFAITLTGSLDNAQALTTTEYLSQTWSTGIHMMQLLRNLVRDADHRTACGCPMLYHSMIHSNCAF